MSHPNSFGSRSTLVVGDRQYAYFHLGALDALAGSTAPTLPFSLRVLLENLLRGEDGAFVKRVELPALQTAIPATGSNLQERLANTAGAGAWPALSALSRTSSSASTPSGVMTPVKIGEYTLGSAH